MRAVAACVCSLVLAGCGDSGLDGFSEAEWAMIGTLSPLPEVPLDPTNAYADDPAAAVLGQRFFFDPAFSGPLIVSSELGTAGEVGQLSCASCHDPRRWFSDTRSMPGEVSLGAEWGSRNSPSLVNAGFYEAFFWDGRADSLWMQALVGPAEGGEMNSDRLRIAHVIYERYRDEYDAVFTPPLDAALDPDHAEAGRFPLTGKPKAADADPDGAWETMEPGDRVIVERIFTNWGKALAAYQRLLVSRDAPLDRYVAGDTDAIDTAAKRGLALFIGEAGCVACHSGPIFSDQRFYNIGVVQEGETVPAEDRGRYDAVPGLLSSPFNSAGPYSDAVDTGRLDGVSQAPDQLGAFRTKGLRQVAETAPYQHTGHLGSLQQVLSFYDVGGGNRQFVGTKVAEMIPLHLTEEQRDDLIVFLQTLTGDPPSEALLQDTSP